MTPEQFIESVKRTEVPHRKPITDERILRMLHGAMGVMKEVGEVLDLLEKHVFFGKPLEEERLVDEVGDSNYYMSLLVDAVGTNFEEVFEYNRKKLQKRYPEGFDPEGKEKRG